MTILVPELLLTRQFSVNIPNMAGNYDFVLVSQYSHQSITMPVTILVTNNRYSKLEMTFPTGFGDEHKNGIYNWRLVLNATTVEAGLVKIITEPGGGLGITNFTSTAATEERVADVFYRPNY
jgi:hypothetical protein